VPDEVCVVTEQRCYIPSILLKIRPHFRGRALAVAPAIEDLQSPAIPERSLLVPHQGTVEDGAVYQDHARAKAPNHHFEGC
jgi:hypothetical protein